MKSSESSKTQAGKAARTPGVGGSLYLAFGAIAVVTLFTTVLGLYSFNRFGTVVQRTTTQTIPLVVGLTPLSTLRCGPAGGSR